MTKGPVWSFMGRSLDLGERTHIMGVVNVTPDSFSDGGRFSDPVAAVDQALTLLDQGADIIDIGGESTRPGSDPTPVEEEINRVVPVIQGVLARRDALISIDTMKAPVAQAALDAGALIINDVSALTWDPDMLPLAASSGAGLVLMHMLGKPKTMQQNIHYDDVVAEVADFLLQAAQRAVKAGAGPQAIVVDPGIGFGKTKDHNLELIANLDFLGGLGYPVLLGASRKAFIGAITGREKPADRLWGTVGVHVAGALYGAHIVRVHDAAPVREALAVAGAAAAYRRSP